MDMLASMRLFARVVRTENFSAVGRQLNLAPSSVSRQINALEEALGVRLLIRTTRKVNLTEAGQLYFDHVSRIISEIDEANRAVGELQAAPRGTLRINAPVSFGRVHVAPALPAFLERYPEVQIDFATTDQIIDLIEEGVDIAVRIAELKDSSLIARKLAPMHRVICGSPAYLQRRGTPRTPEDLGEHNCLTFRFAAASNLWRPGAKLWRLRNHAGQVEVPVGGSLSANNAEALVTAALAGLGLILVPSWLVGGYIERGELSTVLGDYRVSPSGIDAAIYAVYPPNRQLSPKVRVFIDFLVERFKARPFLTTGIAA